MKKLLLTVVLLSIYLSAQSQNNLFYYDEDDKVYLSPIANKFLVEFTDNEDKTVLENNSFTHAKVSEKVYEVTGDLLQIQNAGQGVYGVNQLYSIQGSTEIVYMRNAIVLKWKDEVTENEKNDLVAHFGLTYEYSNRLFSSYKVVNSALPISQMIYETGLVKYCNPVFLSDAIPSQYIPNDTFFQYQFHLHNVGQPLNEDSTGIVDADIDAPEAWDITKGDSSIIVAVIDQGVTSNHPDIPNSRQLRLAGSDFYDYPTTVDDDPSPIGNEAHGNHAAGVVAAEMDNHEGVVGVAPQCKIMPIRVKLSAGVDVPMMAAAVTFAVDNGAHVISCSWGLAIVQGGGPTLIDAIEDAIDAGVVVVFASGNQANHYSGDTGFIEYPANRNEQIGGLIVVGASDRNDKQANYSSNSNNGMGIINIVAPSNTADNDAIPGEADNIWTTDIPDNTGYNPYPFDNILPPLGEELPASGTNYLAYTGRFGGTSAATPQVAGVVALMLSVNPCLSVEQVAEILYSTADKIGDYDYNWQPGISKELGHGKVNAFEAVSLAEALYNDGLDLYTKDVPEDLGLEPDQVAENLWESEDIWVFNYENYGLDYGLLPRY